MTSDAVTACLFCYLMTIALAVIVLMRVQKNEVNPFVSGLTFFVTIIVVSGDLLLLEYPEIPWELSWAVIAIGFIVLICQIVTARNRQGGKNATDGKSAASQSVGGKSTGGKAPGSKPVGSKSVGGKSTGSKPAGGEYTGNKSTGSSWHQSGQGQQGTWHSQNELDAYRVGGPLRRATTGHPSGPREALLELLAVYSAAGMRTTFYDRSTGLRDELEAIGGSKVDYIEVQFTATRTVEDIHWKNRSVPVVDLGTAYNDMVEGNSETICLSSTEVDLVRQMALSKLADDVPTAVMRMGRLYL